MVPIEKYVILICRIHGNVLWGKHNYAKIIDAENKNIYI